MVPHILFGSSSVVRSDGATVGNLTDIPALDDALHSELIPTAKYRAHGSRKFRNMANGNLEWRCPWRPFVAWKSSSSQLCNARASHLECHHEGRGLPGRIQPIPVELRRALWKCPMCDFGTPSDQQGKGCANALKRVKLQHRRTAHPRTSAKAWNRKCKIEAQTRDAALRQRVRVMSLNSAVSRRPQSLQGTQWNHFTTLVLRKVHVLVVQRHVGLALSLQIN